MNKKSKIQLVIIVIVMILLSTFLIYQIGYTIYDYFEKTNKSEKIVSEVIDLYESNKEQIILFASPTCQWCKKFVPVLDEITEENNLSYYYLDVSVLFDNDLNKILETLKIKFSGIPHLVVLRNKEIVGEQSGAHQKEDTIEFFKKVKVIEGDDKIG